MAAVRSRSAKTQLNRNECLVIDNSYKLLEFINVAKHTFKLYTKKPLSYVTMMTRMQSVLELTESCRYDDSGDSRR